MFIFYILKEGKLSCSCVHFNKTNTGNIFFVSEWLKLNPEYLVIYDTIYTIIDTLDAWDSYTVDTITWPDGNSDHEQLSHNISEILVSDLLVPI